MTITRFITELIGAVIIAAVVAALATWPPCQGNARATAQVIEWRV